MALYRNGSFVTDDPWRILGADEPVPPAGPVALPKARFLAEREALVGRNAPLGVVIEAGEGLDGLEDDIHRLSLIVLTFPKYTDGRSYSTARILRERFSYRGELRATGNVLRDQLRFMVRCGFDALEIVHEGTIAALKEGRIKLVSLHYQPASRDEDIPPVAGGRPWRRCSAGLL